MWWLVAAGVSHFSMVGFPVDITSAQTAGADFEHYVQLCNPEPLSKEGLLCVVKDHSGAELWVSLLDKGEGPVELNTANPAFSGRGKTKIVVTADASPPEWKPYEVRIQAQFASGEAPLILDLADPREASRFIAGAKLEVDVTAFADEIALHDSEQVYYASQKDVKVKFASNHFIPSGMFSTGSDQSGQPQYSTAHALFAGKILEAELRNNATGGGKFWWVLVQTFDGATFNVVADPIAVKTAPRIGGILSGSFWLSARLAER